MSNRKVLIVYNTITGNTRNLVEIVSELLERQYELIVHTATTRDKPNIEEYSLVLLGSYTWDDGELPPQMKRYLKNIFVDSPVSMFPQFAVLGTGDTQFGGEKWFCRAVDAMEYYCEKYAVKPLASLKIEQNPMSNRQLNDIWEYVIDVMKGMDDLDAY